MDARTRALERRWRESGDRAAGVRYLQALLRAGVDDVELLRARRDVGELTEERLRLAAALGHAAARALVDARALELTTRDVAELAWVQPATVRSWTARGCPSGRRGSRYVFEPERLVAWAQGPGAVVVGRRFDWAEVCGFVCPESLWVLLTAIVRELAGELGDPRHRLHAARAPVLAWCAEPSPEAVEAVLAALPPDGGGLGLLLEWLPRMSRDMPLHASEVRRYEEPLTLARARALLVPWALAFEPEQALASAHAVQRARLSIDRRPAPTMPPSPVVQALLADLTFPAGPDPVGWFRRLASHGAQPTLRAIVAVARAALVSWRAARPDDLAGDAVVLGLERCAREPGAEAVAELRARAEPMRQAVIEAQRGRGQAPPQALACGYVLADAALVLQPSSTVEDLARDATETVALALGRVSYAHGVALEAARLVSAIVDELTPWAFGNDPLEAA